jgi:anti-anti-sigma regulatory factor
VPTKYYDGLTDKLPAGVTILQLSGRWAHTLPCPTHASSHCDSLYLTLPLVYIYIYLSPPSLPSLTYPSANDVKDLVVELQEETGAAAVVIDFFKVQHIDYTGVAGLRELLDELREDGTGIYAANVLPRVEVMLHRGKVLHRITLCTSVPAAINTAHSDIVEKATHPSTARLSEEDGGNDPTQRLLGNMPPSNYAGVN